MGSKGHCPLWDCLVNFGKKNAEIRRFGMAIRRKGFLISCGTKVNRGMQEGKILLYQNDLAFSPALPIISIQLDHKEQQTVELRIRTDYRDAKNVIGQ